MRKEEKKIVLIIGIPHRLHLPNIYVSAFVFILPCFHLFIHITEFYGTVSLTFVLSWRQIILAHITTVLYALYHEQEICNLDAKFIA